MDISVIFVVMRMFERIATILVGALLILLGYNLFLKLPDLQDAKGNVKLPKNVSVYLSNIGPGAFFALFGSIIVAISLVFGMSLEQSTGVTSSTSPFETPATVQSIHGIGGGASSDIASIVSDREIKDVGVLIVQLNKMPEQLKPDLPPSERVPLIADALPRIKLTLMESIWDSQRWGDQAAFRTWVIEGGADASSQSAQLVEPAAIDFFNLEISGGE